MKNLSELKQFVFNGILLEDSFDRLEGEGISIKQGHNEVPIERVEASDFTPRIIHQANKMSSIYTVFFCLENSVRELITDRLAERKGVDWWEICVPKKIKDSVQKLKEQEEKNRYHTQRSSSSIGYTMFGNLAQIILNNWDEFSDLFPTQAWVNARFTDLEMSRNIIMHTGVLPEMEIERIESICRDWIRQVG
ncbi:Swt1 family HEPN domain-containing protein [Alteromonas sp. 1_MG-2023]|uniref:Swt1 family HEPN domain-containing protein n=1 Tax=Alteromonas sp. 1_MG-2023 TaxID=3062669 RepID=UPI0026E2DC6F|nr:Swt1 family HEPN domain-containing protein [Alteromonas sp. 1_MG-2023]MDO6477944.1 Swt1 family HEPN domain-containing protein [Alteromonas sp. 1_MG-2023]